MFGLDFQIPTEGLNIQQLTFLMLVYGWIISKASNTMADGAELLLSALGPQFAPIVGGILIPLLGVLPDSMMILMSGLGDKSEVAESLKVGAGTLIGSTVLLLTVPTSLGIFLNRRQLGGKEHRALAKSKIRTKKVLNVVSGEIEEKEVLVTVPVLPKAFSLFNVGGTALNTTPKAAKVMMLTSLTYGFLQIPAFFFSKDADGGAKHESWFAFAGMIVAAITFVIYLWWVANDEDALEIVAEKQRTFVEKFHIVNGFHNVSRVLKTTTDPFLQADQLFELFDTDGSGKIDFEEMKEGWKKIGYNFDDSEARQSFNMLDHDRNGCIERHEFCNWIEDFLLDQYIQSQPAPAAVGNLSESGSKLDDILEHFPLPSQLKQGTIDKLKQFLNSEDLSTTKASFVLEKDERFALRVWCSTIQHFYKFALHAVVEDLAGGSNPSDVMSVVSKGTKTHKSGGKAAKLFDLRQISIEKLDKRTSQTYHLRPKQQPAVPGVSAWACASPALIAFYKTTTSTLDPLTTLFEQYAGANQLLSLDQLQNLVKKYQVPLQANQVKFLFYSYDVDCDHFLTRGDLKMLLASLVDMSQAAPEQQLHAGSNRGVVSNSKLEQQPLLVNSNQADGAYSALGDNLLDDADREEEDDEDEEDEEDEHAHMTSTQMLRTAALYILGGTFIVTMFSDPLVEVIGETGKILEWNPFYISFLVTPLASNASEFIAAIKFAAKKTDVSLGLTLSSLYGAATMNNTICLAVFMGLIHFRELAWTNTAETLSVLTVILTIGIIGLKQTIPLWKAIVMFAMFPISVAMIYFLNAAKIF